MSFFCHLPHPTYIPSPYQQTVITNLPSAIAKKSVEGKLISRPIYMRHVTITFGHSMHPQDLTHLAPHKKRLVE